MNCSYWQSLGVQGRHSPSHPVEQRDEQLPHKTTALDEQKAALAVLPGVVGVTENSTAAVGVGLE